MAATGRDWPEVTDPPTWAAGCDWLTATAPIWQADDFRRDYVYPARRAHGPVLP